MPVGVLVGAAVATPKCLVRRIGDPGASFFGLGHHRIHFGLAGNIVSKREFRGALWIKGNFSFVGE